MKYFAKALNKIEYDPRERNGVKVAVWNGLKVGVFKVENEIEEPIGEYERNYPSFFNTFFHFRKDGKDFALYSPNYSVTRIMELPSCRDIGGEEPNSYGFCPTDYFVPTYIEQEIITETKGSMGKHEKRVTKKRLNNPKTEDFMETVKTYAFRNDRTGENCETVTVYRPLSAHNFPFGFVAGCIWGDDSTYKIQYLDLSEVGKGILKRDDRFGYIVLPENQSLKEAIDMYDYGWDEEDESANYIRISVLQTFDLTTGKKIE